MLNYGPFKSFLFISYIGNNENPPITDEIGWSLDIRYSEVKCISKDSERAITGHLEPPRFNVCGIYEGLVSEKRVSLSWPHVQRLVICLSSFQGTFASRCL